MTVEDTPDEVTATSGGDVWAALLPGIEAALGDYYRGDPSGYLARLADDAVYVDVWSGRILDRAGTEAHMLGYADSIPPLDWEITDAELRPVRDGVVIVYRLVLTPPGGDGPVAAWHISEVLRPSGAEWEVVHANIAWDGSFGAPPPLPSGPTAPG